MDPAEGLEEIPTAVLPLPRAALQGQKADAFLMETQGCDGTELAAPISNNNEDGAGLQLRGTPQPHKAKKS